MSKKRTHEEFLKEIYEKNQWFRNGYFTILTDYIKARSYVYTQDEHGVCKITADALLRGSIPCIKKSIDKTDYYKNMVYKVNEYNRRGEFVITGEYKGSDQPIEVTTKYGKCMVFKYTLMGNNNAKIMSAIDRDSYFRNMVYDRNILFREGKFEIISKYDDDLEKILIQDKYATYNVFKETLFTPHKPTIVSAVNKIEFLTNHSNEQYGVNTQDLSQSNYKNSHVKIKIKCNKHNEYFFQTTSNFLNPKKGNSCSKCIEERDKESNRKGWTRETWKESGGRSKNFDSFKVYIIKCWDENEEFYKVGVTYRKLKYRLKSFKKLSYKIEIIKVIEGTAYETYDLENELIEQHKPNKYLPNKKFGGITECFSQINLEIINKCVSLMKSNLNEDS